MEEETDPVDFGVTPSSFLEWRSPRFGDTNPTKFESAVWEWLFRSKLSGYGATERMNGPSPFQAGPTFCFDRYGQSCTSLPDGRLLYIGGEHEDYYDPDFCIYNDVVVEHPDGQLEFYCYPRSDFLPTDFHTSTLVDSQIVIVGSLGYPDDRRIGRTQIYLLDTRSYRIERVENRGDSPGWIHKHGSRLADHGGSIIVTGGMVDLVEQQSLRENIDEWEIDLKTWQWTRRTKRNWPRWEVFRQDRGNNHLWEMRQALWHQSVNWLDDYEQQMTRLIDELGCEPDVSSIADLYRFPFGSSDLVEDEDEHNVFWIYVNEVRVRFVEERYSVKVTVEGELPEPILQSMKASLRERLSKLENTPCELDVY